jgi:hypothetical protein
VEDILAIVLIFGGGTLTALSFSPVGRAFAERLRARHSAPAPDPAVYEELDQLRQDVTELQERVDFAERMVAQSREAGEIGKGAS